jgi:CRP/FNR family cyclic AMP-dependent transcriptional regulator
VTSVFDDVRGPAVGAATTVEGAWRHSPFREVGAATRTELLASATLHTVRPGDIVQRAHGPAQISLVVEGLIRILATAANGRRVAFRYAQSGECVGLISSIVQQQNVEAEAFIDGIVLRFDPHLVGRHALHDPALSWAVAEDAARTAATVMDAARRSMFGSIRSRVAWHLLDMAVVDTDGLVVHANQWQVAESVGSVRDVVARTMNDLVREHLLWRSARGWRVLDPAGLHLAADTDRPPLG